MAQLKKITNIVRYLTGIPKSIYVNFRVLPFKEAIYLPIIVSRKTKLQSLSGKVFLGKVKTGIIRIGFSSSNITDFRYHRTLLRINGSIHFEGKAKIGMGSRVFVAGTLHVGNNFITTGDGMIVCDKKISIGSDTMMSWESVIMDSDQHAIFDADKKLLNANKEVTIGNNVWIGARVFILKNSVVSDGTIIGANSLVNNKFYTPNVIIAGNPAKEVKENISWQH